MKTVYLAGGFYADDWQKKVKKYFKRMDTHSLIDGISFLDPKEKERDMSIHTEIFKNPKTYTFWDINAINNSDIVFAYIDKDNPAVGVITEIGYAKGKGKIVIAVIEKDHVFFKDRYFDFVRNLVDVNFDDLYDGINFLKTLI